MPSASEVLYALATATARSTIVVGTAKNAGKTTVFNALRAVAERRAVAIGVTSIGRDGEPADALDGRPKPRVRLAAGTVAALPAGLLPRSPALELLDRGAAGALGTTIFARAVQATQCEIGGPPTARGMRATIDRLRALCDGPVFVDGAIDRVAALAGGDDAVIVATGAGGATVERTAVAAADVVARLTVPGRDPVREREPVHRIEGALDARTAQALLEGERGLTVVVAEPTRIAVRAALLARLRAHVDLRCERPLRVIACTTSAAGLAGAPSPREVLAAVARATGLPAFDVVAGLAS